MRCIPIGVTKSGQLKIIVFGERNLKDTEHVSKIRYVDKFRVTKIA